MYLKKKHVPSEHYVTAILCLLCHVIPHVQYVLYLYISTSRSICAVPSIAVFCSSLISPFPGTLLRYCPSHFQTVPVAPIITGITFVFTVHMRSVSTVQSLYFQIFSASLLLLLLLAAVVKVVVVIVFMVIIYN